MLVFPLAAIWHDVNGQGTTGQVFVMDPGVKRCPSAGSPAGCPAVNDHARSCRGLLLPAYTAQQTPSAIVAYETCPQHPTAALGPESCKGRCFSPAQVTREASYMNNPNLPAGHHFGGQMPRCRRFR